MKIGIIGALEEEIENYKTILENPSEKIIAGLTFYSGTIFSKEVVIVKSGVGKVNASLCTQILINIFFVDTIIFTGVAGATNPLLNIGDLVISKDSIQHDMDGEGLGFERGRIPYSDLKFFHADENLIRMAENSCKKLKLNYILGRIMTGDQYIGNTEHSTQIKDLFLGDCVDMEGAAVAQVCIMNKVIHLIIRSISDKADHQSKINFNEFVKLASKNSFNVVTNIIKDLKTEL